MAGPRKAQQAEQNTTTVELEDDVDALFKLPLAEFTAARNALAAGLKKAGKPREAEHVKALVKPSISAWAVNQLYWKHRDAFEGLIAAGKRLGTAQASQLAGRAADLRDLLAARREALSDLARSAAALLRDAGHNPTPDMMRRVTTTLEALSTYASSPNGPPQGRLTTDLDPPGFESLTALIPNTGRAERRSESRRVMPLQPAARPGTRAAPVSPRDLNKREEGRKAAIASAKAQLQAAEQTLRTARKMAQQTAAVLKRATAHADETERNRREAEKRLEKATAAAEEARRRLQSVTEDAEKAIRALEDTQRDLEDARKNLKELAEE